MTPQDWSRIQQGIFSGESGGDYGALFGYQNRPGGKFADIDLTKMTIDEALEFANPSGNYGQFVKGQVGRVATPMGAYQVVGSTLRDAKKGLGFSGQETMSPEVQDIIGKWIYKTQGTGAWEGYKPLGENQAIASQAMQVLGKSPKGLLAPTQTPETETKPMIQQQKPRGLLENLGIQKMEEGAEGETGQRFFQRDTFKDAAARMAPLLASMGSSPALQKATAGIAAQRTEKNARNKTAEYLRANGMSDMAELMMSGQISARDVGTALMNKKLGAGSGQGVQSSSALRDRSGVVLTMRDGSIVVKTAGGETISGDAALKFVRDSEEAYAASEKSIYGARTEGTLEAETELGAAAEAARTSGRLSMELGFDTLDKANAVLSSLSTIDSAIAAIDDGAKAGPVYKMLPNITESSAALSTAMNQMGLDVISSVTFGALSEGEMKLAMETAVPRDLGPEALRSYLVKKRDAQAKAAAALQNAARYLTKPKNSISGWLEQQEQQQGSGAGETGVSDDPLGLRN